jgi:hypothetical protein
MTLTKKTVTDLVIEWLDKNEYSREHWKVVALDMMTKSENDQEKAIELLAEGLKSFHHVYKSKVIQKDNLLDDLVSHSLAIVDWKEVAVSRYKKK